VYGKSEHRRSENPNTPVCGKSEREERKSSSEKNGQKERSTGRSAEPKNRATPKAPRNPEASLKPTPLRTVDDEIPQAHAPIVFATPEDLGAHEK